eukprot:TRINITY_DN2379_c1_g1_i1.p2 TRINITY_DN2379_c1_g1~~TRINITY_DN2379_c1_g1_i1.p2  ORF type:complete len:185 (+),score=-17.84 TRINITY_DN2379_c1_g1_i1:410-964(+)
MHTMKYNKIQQKCIYYLFPNNYTVHLFYKQCFILNSRYVSLPPLKMLKSQLKLYYQIIITIQLQGTSKNTIISQTQYLKKFIQLTEQAFVKAISLTLRMKISTQEYYQQLLYNQKKNKNRIKAFQLQIKYNQLLIVTISKSTNKQIVIQLNNQLNILIYHQNQTRKSNTSIKCNNLSKIMPGTL